MRGIIKRTGVLLLTGIMLCSIASCSTEKEEVKVVEDLEGEPEYLSFFSGDKMFGASVEKYWIDRFAEEYERPVYVEFDGAAYYSDQGISYRELLEKRLESSAPDDLYIISAEDVIDFEKKGYWMDLSELDAVNNLSEAALDQSTYNGQVFSIPLSLTGFGFYWNVDLLNEFGLSVPGNLDEFIKTCAALKAEGVLPYGTNKGFALTVPAMCTGLSKLYGSPDKTKLIEELNSGQKPISDYMREGFEFLAMLIAEGYMDPVQAMNTVPGEDMDLFLEGECAFICSTLGASRLEEQNVFEIEMTGLPVLEDRTIAVYGASSRLCVNPDSKHLDTVLDFVEMIGTTEALDKSAELEGDMSVAKDSKLTGSAGQEEMCQLLLRNDQIPNQDFALHFNTWENIRDVGREICGGASVDDACKMLDEKQSVELHEYEEKNR